jgi:hypothetical protein
MLEDGTCLLHGNQPIEHFEKETNDIRTCEVCGRGFYCKDEIRKVCNMECAGEYARTRWEKI